MVTEPKWVVLWVAGSSLHAQTVWVHGTSPQLFFTGRGGAPTSSTSCQYSPQVSQLWNGANRVLDAGIPLSLE